MIHPNELRIGNLLISKAGECMVSALGPGEIEVTPWPAAKTSEIDNDDLSYLPLSEEWMNRFSGSESGYLTISELERTSDSSDIIILSTIECYLHDDGFLRVCAYEYDKEPNGSHSISDDVITLGYKHIRYVHQLQNLYFALSGKELDLVK